MPASGPGAIVMITADEMRKDSLGCYGGTQVPTPHLDGLAASGRRMDRAYTVSPWCLPSRCSLVTGCYPHRHGAYSNFRAGRLSPQIPNLYGLMRAAGYTTTHVGKCHYAPVPYGRVAPATTLPYDEFRDYYLQLGIDQLILQDDKQVSVWFEDDYSRQLAAAGWLEAYRTEVWRESNRKVFPFPGPPGWHPDAWVGRKAVECVRRHPEGRPLFLWVSFSGPHFPFDPPAEYLQRIDDARVGQGMYREGEFDDPGRIHHRSFHGPGGIEGSGAAPAHACKEYDAAYWHALRKAYFANVALIDDQVGAILAALADRFGPDTAVVFTADHGEMLGNHRLWGKHACGYEDVLNVPLLLRLPGMAADHDAEGLVAFIDLMPTLAGLTDAAMPEVDGRDLRRAPDGRDRQYVFSEGERFITVSDGRYKYVRSGDLVELLDLVEDPGEFMNLAHQTAYAPVRAQLEQAILDLWMRRLLP